MIKNKQKGVTLVEIAIVLVIIGLLLGGVLKGQELINNAKVRSIADRQNSLKVAWFAFVDRFQALPGEYTKAQVTIPGAGPAVSAAGGVTTGDGILDVTESAVAMQNLTGAGYLRCPQCNATAPVAPAAGNSLQNQYGGTMSIWHDAANFASDGGVIADRAAVLMIHTGPRIPSNIISEVDRKLDDGIPNTGDVVFNQYDSVGAASQPDVGRCTETAVNTAGTLNTDNSAAAGQLEWRFAGSAPPVEQNCGASVAI